MSTQPSTKEKNTRTCAFGRQEVIIQAAPLPACASRTRITATPGGHTLGCPITCGTVPTILADAVMAGMEAGINAVATHPRQKATREGFDYACIASFAAALAAAQARDLRRSAAPSER